MSDVWLIARRHFRQEVFKRGFIMVMLSMPLILSFSIGMGLLAVRLEQETTTLGYVDEAGVLVDTTVPTSGDDVALVAYDSADGARAALQAGEVDGYYVLPSDYATSGKAMLIYKTPVAGSAIREFHQFVRRNLVSDVEPRVAERVLTGADVTVRATEYGREFPTGNPSAGQVMPVVVGMMFAFLIMTTSGYLLGALAEERENRTMEIMMTSTSTRRMMMGKVVAGLGIGLALLVVWTVFLVGAVWIARDVVGLAWLQDLQIDWRDLLAMIAVAVPAQFFFAALMTLIGTLLSGKQEADQVGPLSFLLAMLPIYFIVPLGKSPNSALSIGLSLFPGTTVTTMGLRSLFYRVPWWQVGASAAISILCALGLTWLASKALRVGMLRYGKRTRLRDIFVAS